MKLRQGVYRHYKDGGLYTVLFQAVSADNRDDHEDSVVYVSHTTGQVYTRLVSEFFGRVGEGRELKWRFEFVADSMGPPVRG